MNTQQELYTCEQQIHEQLRRAGCPGTSGDVEQLAKALQRPGRLHRLLTWIRRPRLARRTVTNDALATSPSPTHS